MSGMMRALGLMSGTSMDGIDLALVDSDGEGRVTRGMSGFYAYNPAFRVRLLQGLEDAKAITDRMQRPASLAELERDLTKLHAEAVKQFLSDHHLKAADIDVIGFHGQTVLHRPDQALTVQIGDGAYLAQETGCDVVYDMRANDMRHRGQGAPLVPAYHQALSAQLVGDLAVHDRPLVFVNIGGISNVTILETGKEPVAFDTGPGNALIDQWVVKHTGASFDEGGKLAAAGEINQAVLQSYLSQSFFLKKLPKSLDRNDFLLNNMDGLSLEDGARTLAKLSAEAVLTAIQYLQTPPALWIICGGGRKNQIIMDDLVEGAQRHQAKVISAEQAGFDGDAMEAEAWAYLAIRSLKGLALTYPMTTGCQHPVTGGVLVTA